MYSFVARAVSAASYAMPVVPVRDRLASCILAGMFRQVPPGTRRIVPALNKEYSRTGGKKSRRTNALLGRVRPERKTPVVALRAVPHHITRDDDDDNDVIVDTEAALGQQRHTVGTGVWFFQAGVAGLFIPPTPPDHVTGRLTTIRQSVYVLAKLHCTGRLSFQRRSDVGHLQPPPAPSTGN